MTFFGSEEIRFPVISEEGQVDVVQFLQASRQVVKFIDCLGTTFKIVKSDVNGNIQKLQQKYNTDPEKFQNFEAMLEDEKLNNNTDFAKVGGLWLKRALQFVYVFLSNMVEEYKNGNPRESLQPHIKKAYDETLHKYHNFFTQKMFTVVAITAPTWSSLMKILSRGNDFDDEQIIKDLEVYLDVMATNLDVLSDLYIKYELDSNRSV